MNQINTIYNDIYINEKLSKYNKQYIHLITEQIIKYKKYNLERLQDNRVIKCNKCIKNAIYIEHVEKIHICWYHGLKLTKNI